MRHSNQTSNFGQFVFKRRTVIDYLAFIFLSGQRLGVIEEEREEDERKLNVAVAAAERLNVLVRQNFSRSTCSISILFRRVLLHKY